MNEIGIPTRQQRQMAAMVALERVLCERTEYFSNRTSHNPEVVNLLADLRELTNRHRQALGERLRAIAPDVGIPDPPFAIGVLEELSDGQKYPASTALTALHTLLDQAVIGYSVLLELCLRARDSSLRGPDNSADLVFAHMEDYASAAQRIVRTLHYAVIGELEQEGQECQCTCPSCGLGICLCGVASRRNLGLAWGDAGPIYIGGPVVMVKPRKGSAAAAAGLQKGDLVVAVDDKEFDAIPMLQDSVRGHQPGEAVNFQIQHESGEQSTVVLVRP